MIQCVCAMFVSLFFAAEVEQKCDSRACEGVEDIVDGVSCVSQSSLLKRGQRSFFSWPTASGSLRLAQHAS